MVRGLCAAVFCVLMPVSILFGQDLPVALENARVYTITGGTFDNGVVVMHNGRITAVGPAGAVTVPGDARRIDLQGKVVLPGLVDTHSHIGISPTPGVEANSDGNERSGPIQSGLRALDAIYPGDPRIRFAQAGGITTVNVMPGSGNVIGGATAYIKTRGRTIEEMLINKSGVQGGLKMANGENPKGYGRRNQAPKTRMAVAALARMQFVKARQYKTKWDRYNALSDSERDDKEPPDRDLELEPLVEVLEGKRTVHHHTHRADDILTVLRLQEEFGFDLVLQHVTEGYKVAEKIAAAGVGASIITLDSPGGKHEAIDFSFRNGAVLAEAGVLISFHTDDAITDSRLFLRSAALMVREGLSERTALEALTINGAKMLRLDDRVGSLETGKDADIIILSGPPFSVRTHVLQTWIEGELIFDRNRPADARYATGGYLLGDNYPALEE